MRFQFTATFISWTSLDCFFLEKNPSKDSSKNQDLFYHGVKKNGKAKDLLLKDVIFLGNPSNFQLISVLQKKSTMVVLAVYFYALTQPKIDYHLGKLPLLGIYDAASVQINTVLITYQLDSLLG